MTSTRHRWHPTATPCDLYGSAHGYCYPCATAHAADQQGLQTLALALHDAGYLVTIQQTGGFCMTITAHHPATGGEIVATDEVIAVYLDEEWQDDPINQWTATDDARKALHDTNDPSHYLAEWSRMFWQRIYH